MRRVERLMRTRRFKAVKVLEGVRGNFFQEVPPQKSNLYFSFQHDQDGHPEDGTG